MIGDHSQQLTKQWRIPHATLRLAIMVVCVASMLPVTDGHSQLSTTGSDSTFFGAATDNIDPRGWWMARDQSIGNIRVMGTNNGTVRGSARDACSGELLFHSIEFPKRSNDIWSGFSLWLGGIKSNDTLVTTMFDESQITEGALLIEVWPAPIPEGQFEEHTTREILPRGFFCSELVHSNNAVSEHDLMAIAVDTFTNADLTGVSPFEQRRHIPLGIKLIVKRYAWSTEYAEDFVICEYDVVNMGLEHKGSSSIRNLMIGIQISALAENLNLPSEVGQRPDIIGDLIGRVTSAPLEGRPHLSEPMNLVWVADSDGDPYNGQWDDLSITGAVGYRLLLPGLWQKQINFNWWQERAVHNGWGPMLQNSKVEFNGQDFGTPKGDRGKYQLMTNGESDYPQVEAAVTHVGAGWMPPPPFGSQIANGTHRLNGLLSFGPFDIDANDTISFAIAIVGGEDFLPNPLHLRSTFDPLRPERYSESLDFYDLLKNARWASWLYDAPGFDTDGDGYLGPFFVDGLDTIYYQGDGKPDFRGPPAPPPPRMRVTTRAGGVTLDWNGRATETFVDPFFNRRDFEGYRLYISRTANPNDWRLITQRDVLNYARRTWIQTRERWEDLDPPFTRDSLKALYDSLSLTQYGYAFEPDSFPSSSLEDAFVEIRFDANEPQDLDTVFHYFTPYEANATVDDRALAFAVEDGLFPTGVIRKLFPNADSAEIRTREDGSKYAPFYEYEFNLNGLNVAEPVFFSLSAFDHGDPQSGFQPLESSLDETLIDVWPIASSKDINSTRPKPGVYPNPYRLVDDYNAAGWENPRGLEPDPERARKVTFYNVPDTCTVSIWSLDGDLVRKLNHAEPPGNSEATVVRWNLITRNTQAVKTGIYIWSVESRFGTDVGKLVIIK